MYAPTTDVTANLIICESVLNEGTVKSAIRVVDIMTAVPPRNFIHFFALTFLHSGTLPDLQQHTLRVQMVAADGKEVASAPDAFFKWVLSSDPGVPAAFVLSTEFTIDLTQLVELGTYYIESRLDGVQVAKTPVTLRRAFGPC
jgi:hypothetical protein